MQTLREDSLDVDVGYDEVLFECAASCDDVAGLVDDQTVAVENQFVLAADEITIGRATALSSARVQSSVAVETLARC